VPYAQDARGAAEPRVATKYLNDVKRDRSGPRASSFGSTSLGYDLELGEQSIIDHATAR